MIDHYYYYDYMLVIVGLIANYPFIRKTVHSIVQRYSDVGKAPSTGLSTRLFFALALRSPESVYILQLSNMLSR
jgi:hypothetical protein